MSRPVLSVVIPVFNRPRRAHQAIASALSQKFDGLEVIVVDDASSPPLSLGALADDERVTLIRHGVNRGAAAARNTGMAAARGKWVAFLDSDDVWLPNSLMPRYRMGEEALTAGDSPLTVFVAGFKLVRPGQGITEILEPRPSADPLDFASGCWFSPGSTALFQRDAILGVAGPQDESLRRFEDNDWFLRIALAGGRVMPCDVIAAAVNLSDKPPLDSVMQSGMDIIRKYEALPLEPELRAALLRRLRAWLALECASVNWYAGQKLRALTEVSRSLWHAPRLQLHVAEFWERRHSTPLELAS